MLTRLQVNGIVAGSLDRFFEYLAADLKLTSGDVDPLVDFQWKDHVVPEIEDYVWSWYTGNQPIIETTIVIETVGEGSADGIDVRLMEMMSSIVGVKFSGPGCLVQMDDERPYGSREVDQ